MRTLLVLAIAVACGRSPSPSPSPGESRQAIRPLLSMVGPGPRVFAKLSFTDVLLRDKLASPGWYRDRVPRRA